MNGPQAISLADFDLIRVIGRGSYAKVLMVELKSTKRIYAMKVIKKELVTDDEVSTFKVHLFWEGHKNLTKSPTGFDVYLTLNQVGFCFKFLWPS